MILNILKANARLKELDADNKRLTEALTSKEAEFEDYKSKAHQALTDKDTFTKQLEDLTAEHAKVVESLKLDIEAAKGSANRQAAEVVASLGIPSDTIKETLSQEALTSEQIMAKFEALSGDKKAQAEFYKKHRATILRSQGL